MDCLELVSAAGCGVLVPNRKRSLFASSLSVALSSSECCHMCTAGSLISTRKFNHQALLTTVVYGSSVLYYSLSPSLPLSLSPSQRTRAHSQRPHSAIASGLYRLRNARWCCAFERDRSNEGDTQRVSQVLPCCSGDVLNGCTGLYRITSLHHLILHTSSLPPRGSSPRCCGA